MQKALGSHAIMIARAFDVPSLTATEAFGRRLGRALFPGAVVALSGPLGAGKTNLVRAMALGLDVPDANIVSSPTFVLIQEYAARLPIYHFDAYRLADEAAFDDLGAYEYFEGNGVCLVEWADRVPRAMPQERLEIALTITGPSSRRLDVAAHGARYEVLLHALGLTD